MHLISLSLILLTLVLTNMPVFAEEHSSSENKAIFHAVHSDDVRNIMRRLKLLIYERENSELEIERLRNKQISLLAEEANKLANTAEDLPDIASLQSLNDEERLTFTAMANQLHDITLEMEKAINTNHQQELDEAYIKLQDTCNTCHKLFRVW